MRIPLPREAVVAACVIAAQLLYSRIYPWILDLSEGAQDPQEPTSPSPWPPTPSPPVQAAPPSASPEAADRADPSAEDEDSFFAASAEPRARPAARRGGPKFRVGQVVRDRVLLARGAIVGWDAHCRAPGWWRRARLATEDWASKPHYLVLADIRDLAEEVTPGSGQATLNATFYAPEATLELAAKGTAPLLAPLLPYYFSLFDGSSDTYIPHYDLARRYPDDVHRHYLADPDRLPDADPKGRLLFRVVEHGRLIAHGPPVPVVRAGMFLVASEGVRGEMFERSVVLLLQHGDEEGTLGVIVNKNASDAERKLSVKTGNMAIEHMMDRLQQMQRQAAAGQGVGEKQLKQLAEELERGEALLKLLRAPGVELRTGGPVGLEQFPIGPHHILLHPFRGVKGSKLALAGSGSASDPDLFYVHPALLRKRDIDALAKRARQLAPELREAGQRLLVFRGNSAWGPKQLAGEIRGALEGGSSWGWLPASPRDVLGLLSSGRSVAGARPGGGGAGQQFWRQLQNSTALQRLEAG